VLRVSYSQWEDNAEAVLAGEILAGSASPPGLRDEGWWR
jgi:hypothetical protein